MFKGNNLTPGNSVNMKSVSIITTVHQYIYNIFPHSIISIKYRKV